MTSNDDANGLDWQRYEAEVVDLGAERVRRDWADLDDQAAAHPVDSPEAQRPASITIAGLKAGQRRPLVPAWLRSRAHLRDTARWAAGYAAHTSAYHLTRSPKYAAKLAFRSPVGAGRVVRTFTRWVFDLEGEPVRQHTVRQEDPETYLKLSRQRDRRVRWRGMVAVFILGVLLAAGGVVALCPPMPRYAALAVLVTLLGVIGRPADRPLLDTAVMVPRVARLTSDVVSRALSVLGIAGITQALAKNPKAITFPAPITRDGPGWRADVELPYGVTATEVIERREKLAAGLARPLGCVWPEGNASVHPGRLVLWVGDEDMSNAKRPTWPLLKSGTVDLFKPQPFGTDQRGRWEHLTLMFIAMVIGSIPRMGKTFALRLALLIAALDPRAEVHAYDLKGTGDLSALAQVAHRYRAGDEEDDIEYALAAMRELRDELRRRAKVIRELPQDLCPENKVTPDLASKKALRLHPIVIGVDECQVWFEHPEYGKEFEAICTDLVKRGPALGIVLILATQRPDAKSLPTGISANASVRYCLKVMGQTENDMVLGTSKYKQGVRATMFSWQDKGIGYFVGEGADARIVGTVYIDGPAAERIALRARAARISAGTLTGHAAGQAEPDTTATARRDTLLDDILTVVPPNEPKIWTETVIDRLTGLRPAVYAAMTRDQLTATLKAAGIGTGQVWGTDSSTGKGANRRGIERRHVASAVADRNQQRGTKAAS